MTGTLVSLSDALAETVSTLNPSVVRVQARRRQGASGIVWSADGVVVTTHHAIERTENITITLHDGESPSATFVARDPTTDIAVLRIEKTCLTVAVLDAADDLRVGNIVVALARPGQSVRTAMGMISALGDNWRSPSGGHFERYMQPDIVMYPGFSGGPLVNAEGSVLGINTSAILRNTPITIPVQTLQRIVAILLEHGEIARGYIGVGVQSARLPEAVGQQLEQETGLLLVSVDGGAPAETGGLLLGDTIVTLDGQPVRHLDDLINHLSGDQIGREVNVGFVRGGETRETKVVVGVREKK